MSLQTSKKILFYVECMKGLKEYKKEYNLEVGSSVIIESWIGLKKKKKFFDNIK